MLTKPDRETLIRRKRLAVWLLGSLACWGLALGFMHTHFVQRVEAWTTDWRFLCRGPRVSAAQRDIVIVTIDEATFQQIDKPMMLWRPEFAEVIERLHASGARAIGIDVLYPNSLERWFPGYDRRLAVTLARTPGIVLISMWQKSPHGGLKLLEPTAQLKYALDDERRQIGFADFYPDVDGYIRTQRLSEGQGADRFTCLAAQLSRQMGHPLPASPIVRINYLGPPHTFTRVPFYTLTDRYIASQQGTPARQTFTGKVVLIGADYTGSGDYHLTPLYHQLFPQYARRMAGVEIQANILATLLDRRPLRNLSTTTVATLLLVLAIAAGWAFTFPRLLVSIGALFGAGIAWGALACILFARDITLEMSVPLLLLLTLFTLCFLYRYMGEERERRYIYDVLGRFVSRDVAQQLIHRQTGLRLDGERVLITVLVADIRGFTKYCESADHHEVLRRLNAFFKTMVPIIARYGGTIDKYIGDAIMTVFGAPLAMDDHVARAVCCAIEMRQAFQAWQADHGDGPGGFTFCIGIHTGSAVAGHIGTEERMEYSVLGHTVNIAFRIEAANRDLGTQILLSHAVRQVLGDCIDVEGPHHLCVKETSIVVYQLLTMDVPAMYKHLGHGTPALAHFGRKW
ncbi:MAG: CHASE2 domain-containing protein [Armatimonadota bacterium]